MVCFLNKQNILRDLLERTKMLECSKINTLVAVKVASLHDDQDAVNAIEYRSIVGVTRPYIHTP